MLSYKFVKKGRAPDFCAFSSMSESGYGPVSSFSEKYSGNASTNRLPISDSIFRVAIAHIIWDSSIPQIATQFLNIVLFPFRFPKNTINKQKQKGAQGF